jgi:hypothetical protein
MHEVRNDRGQVITTAAATVGTSAGNPMAAFYILGMITLGFGVILMLPLADMLLGSGDVALFRTPAIPVSSVSKGRVALSGIVEPAWAVVKPPFADLACVWYDAAAEFHFGKSGFPIFEEVNAVPFVLNDGTGRILVLARRARWDPANMSPSRWRGKGWDPEPRDGASDPEIADMLNRSLEPAPPLLKSFQKEGYEHSAANTSVTCVPVGQRVTVFGTAIHFMMAGVDERDACPDDGSSLGLSGGYVMAPDELVVHAGSAAAIKHRMRIWIALAPLGAVLVIAGVVMLRVA